MWENIREGNEEDRGDRDERRLKIKKRLFIVLNMPFPDYLDRSPRIIFFTDFDSTVTTEDMCD
jgi:hypothetical protein